MNWLCRNGRWPNWLLIASSINLTTLTLKKYRGDWPSRGRGRNKLIALHRHLLAHCRCLSLQSLDLWKGQEPWPAVSSPPQHCRGQHMTCGQPNAPCVAQSFHPEALSFAYCCRENNLVHGPGCTWALCTQCWNTGRSVTATRQILCVWQKFNCPSPGQFCVPTAGQPATRRSSSQLDGHSQHGGGAGLSCCFCGSCFIDKNPSFFSPKGPPLQLAECGVVQTLRKSTIQVPLLCHTERRLRYFLSWIITLWNSLPVYVTSCSTTSTCSIFLSALDSFFFLTIKSPLDYCKQ